MARDALQLIENFTILSQITAFLNGANFETRGCDIGLAVLSFSLRV
jgi:hypothetical protein